MNKREKEKVLAVGRSLLTEVSLHPNAYYIALGSYLNNQTLFGKLIRWHQRCEASHSSIVFVRKGTNTPALEIHALEGWGVIATDVGALGKSGATLELRAVDGVADAGVVLERVCNLIGSKYQKPVGFITKSRADDFTRWFCSELANCAFNLQNCANHLVSPAWARRSPKASKIIAEIKM